MDRDLKELVDSTIFRVAVYGVRLMVAGLVVALVGTATAAGGLAVAGMIAMMPGVCATVPLSLHAAFDVAVPSAHVQITLVLTSLNPTWW